MTKNPPNSLNLNVRGMRPSATVAINELSDRLRVEGRRVYKLGLGQSPFPVPEPVVECLRENAHQKDYLPTRGLPALRAAIADYHRRKRGIERTADDVLIGPGSKELMFLLQLVFYGDLVIPSPSWVSYEPQARIIGRRVRWVSTERSDGWCLTPDVFRELCEEDPERPSLVVLNYPNNPTGGSYSPAQLEAIADIARRHGVLLLSDEIYGELHHRGEHVSIAGFYPEGTIVSGGLSKWCGAGGWRLGCFVFPPNLRWLQNAMVVAASETFTSTCAPIQYAAVAAYQENDEIEDYLVRARRVCRSLGVWVAARLRAAGAHCDDPEGGFYVFADFSDLAERLRARGVRDSSAMCRRLLEDTGVAVLPGTDFGRAASELSLRLAYVDFDGGQALAAAAAVPGDDDLDEAFLRRTCGDVLEAIDRIHAWIEAPPPAP